VDADYVVGHPMLKAKKTFSNFLKYAQLNSDIDIADILESKISVNVDPAL